MGVPQALTDLPLPRYWLGLSIVSFFLNHCYITNNTISCDVPQDAIPCCHVDSCLLNADEVFVGR